MRIIEVEYLGPPALGGVEKVVETLSRRFLTAGHEAEIWCTDFISFGGPKHEAGTASVDGLIVRRFPAGRSRFVLVDPYHVYWSGLDAALLEEGARGSVIHLHPFPSYHVLMSFPALKAGAPIVITPHHEVESLRRYRKLWRGKWQLKSILIAARRFPRLCLGVHTSLEETFWTEEAGWPKEQIKVIPNGVDLAEFDNAPASEIETAKSSWPKGEIRLLFVGRLSPAKGIDTLLRAVAQTPEASLLVVGPDAGARDDLMKLQRELGLQDRVTLTGALPRDEVCAAFRAADISLLPSRFGENFGIAAIEAMAAGKPVVVSDCGGLPTIVKHEKNGLIFPAGAVDALRDALKRLIASEDLRRRLAQAGRKSVEANYTWQRVAQEYLALFSAAIAAAPKR